MRPINDQGPGITTPSTPHRPHHPACPAFHPHTWRWRTNDALEVVHVVAFGVNDLVEHVVSLGDDLWVNRRGYRLGRVASTAGAAPTSTAAATTAAAGGRPGRGSHACVVGWQGKRLVKPNPRSSRHDIATYLGQRDWHHSHHSHHHHHHPKGWACHQSWPGDRQGARLRHPTETGCWTNLIGGVDKKKRKKKKK